MFFESLILSNVPMKRRDVSLIAIEAQARKSVRITTSRGQPTLKMIVMVVSVIIFLLPAVAGAAVAESTPLLYVVNQTSNSVAGYHLNENAAQPAALQPSVVIAGPHTGLSNPYAIAVGPQGELFVATDAGYINLYPPGSNGDVTPLVSMEANPSCSPFTFDPTAIAVDKRGTVYATNASDGPGGITIFGPNRNGCMAANVIAGSRTYLSHPYGIAVDEDGTIYTANSDMDFGPVGITEYRPGVLGNVAPIRRIAGPRTLLDQYTLFLALDHEHNLYVTQDIMTARGFEPSVLEFARHADGNAAPMRVISGAQTLLRGETTQLSGMGDLAVDHSGNIYVLTADGAINIYPPGAQGNAPPIQRLHGSANGLDDPTAIAISNR